MRFAIASLLPAVLVASAPAAQSGLRIVTRETAGVTVIETTEYVQSDRSCIETRVAAARPAANREPLTADVRDHRTAHLTRCDLQKVYVVSYADRTYMTGPLPSYPSRAHRLLASAAPEPPPTPDTPDLVIETTTVQTGERKMAFGYAARRVITTRREIPREASAGERSEIGTDGWYIDLDTRPSCQRSELIARAVLVGTISRTVSPDGRPARPPSIGFKEIGTPERGYPIEVTTTSRIPAGAGFSGGHTMITHKAVTELSRVPLDPALFEIPPGFRRAGGPPAALWEQWSRAWISVKGFVAAWFW